MQDVTKPSFIIPNDNQINIKIPLSDSTPNLVKATSSPINISIPLSDNLPYFIQTQSSIPHINSITDIKIPIPTPPPVGGSQTNFSIGWWMYVNDQPFVPNNTNFGPGWFMYVNSK